MNFVLLLLVFLTTTKCAEKRSLQKSHEKPPWMKWSDTFLGTKILDQQAYMVKLLKKITENYLVKCPPVILYDSFTELYDNLILEKLLKDFPTMYVHGQIDENYRISIIVPKETCLSYILFVKDVLRIREIIGENPYNRIVVVAKSSQWRVLDFLSREESRYFVNLLVIVKSEDIGARFKEKPYILYTHELYTDALGSSRPVVLTSYQNEDFTRHVDLFPKKKIRNFAGHRFLVSLAQQPPFIITKGRDVDSDKVFEGKEIRLIELLKQVYNFTIEYKEATEDTKIGSTEAVTRTVMNRKANLGIGGIYMTSDKIDRVGLSQWHTQDCAAFISLSSTALPRYRAIMGPFHWTVWMSITSIYLLGILPLVFSEKQTLTTLLTNPEEFENMFWYVFGTFTNCFTFSGNRSWTKADKLTTKILIGFYWLFTIIVTACYTGSIIAFVTLPIYPDVIDSVQQLLGAHFQIGTLDKGEWQYLFLNSSDPVSEKLLKNLDLVPDIESGLKNVTKSFFWNYAFLGSRAQLDYIVRTNFSTGSKRSVLHISKECFVPFNVAIIFPKNSIYDETINNGLNLIMQSGILNKLNSDVEWEMMRSSTGKLLAANSVSGSLRSLTYEDRALNLDDTQGMFLLLGAGFLIGITALFSEIFGGCFNLCKRKRHDSASTIESNPRYHERQTPRDWQQVQFVRYFTNHKCAEIQEHNNTDTVSNNSVFGHKRSDNSLYHQEDEDNLGETRNHFENFFGEKFNHEESDNEHFFGEKFNHEESDKESIATI